MGNGLEANKEKLQSSNEKYELRCEYMKRQIVFLFENYPRYFKAASSSKLADRTKRMSIKIIMEYILRTW